MLKACGYTTKYSFINFSKEDITNIEEFARNTLLKIYNDMDNICDTLSLYDLYGPFDNHRDKFIILPGFSNHLFILSHYISQDIMREEELKGKSY